MTKNEQFEKLYLNTSVNPILATDYPANFPLHWHQYVEIMALPHDANMLIAPTVTVNNTDYTLQPGDMIFAWSGELHKIHQNTDKQVVALQFPGNLITELPEFMPLLNSFRSIHIVSAKEHPELSQLLQAHIKHMSELKTSGTPFSNVEILICLYELFIALGTYVRENQPSQTFDLSEGSHQSLSKMTHACSYISENCEQVITLDDIAEQFGFSSYYFSRLFKSATGYNFTEYLTLQRVKRAQLFLADSDMNITEIAFSSGFKSISSFNRAFRQIRGCAPRDYRKYHSAE
ncbi:MAG: helix-turn-helix transcriptional regulator [Lachnospiraceae bacterium]|nr:helix-turn-helix transcriptional regulator [Lachnospiraceae bacterium]